KNLFHKPFIAIVGFYADRNSLARSSGAVEDRICGAPGHRSLRRTRWPAPGDLRQEAKLSAGDVAVLFGPLG
ncbi:MAG: hypothetical protein WCJ64_22865, partial [Rhodospirillaceae bacterium]